ncbi:MAG: cupin domain-containing protein [Anaerolineales bacterium]
MTHPTHAPLNEMIVVQEGAIVSKTLVNQKSGTLTLFAFDQGQSLSEHSSPYTAWLYVVSGQARVTIGGEGYDVQAGEIIELPADVPHAVEAPQAFKMMLTMIR